MTARLRPFLWGLGTAVVAFVIAAALNAVFIRLVLGGSVFLDRGQAALGNVIGWLVLFVAMVPAGMVGASQTRTAGPQPLRHTLWGASGPVALALVVAAVPEEGGGYWWFDVARLLTALAGGGLAGAWWVVRRVNAAS